MKPPSVKLTPLMSELPSMIQSARANTEQVEQLDLGSANIQVADSLDKIPDMKLLREQLQRSVQQEREQAAPGALSPEAKLDGEEQ